MSSSLSLVFLALAAMAAVGYGSFFFRDFDDDIERSWGIPTFASPRWCRRHCFFGGPFEWRPYCRFYCVRRPFFLSEPACGELMLWGLHDSCTKVTQRFGITGDAFKTLNPFFQPDSNNCDDAEHTKYAGSMMCVKEAAVGEEAHPLPCQQFHAVAVENRKLSDVAEAHGMKPEDLALLNPTVKPDDALVPGQILCDARDNTKDAIPPCDRFYRFGITEGEVDCMSVFDIVKEFIIKDFTIDEYNRLNPYQQCDPKAPLKLVRGHMICIHQPIEPQLDKPLTIGGDTTTMEPTTTPNP